MSIRILPPELQIIVENELNEKPDEVYENIRIIKEWISQQPHLNARTEDQWILTFLRGCKFSLQKTKQKMDHYYRLRAIAPQMYAIRDPSSGTLKEFLDKGIFLPLDMEGKDRQSFLCRLGAPGADHISLNDITAFAFMICEIVMYENDYAMIKGQNVIYDLKGIPRARVFEMTLTHIKNFVSARQGFPVRIKSITILNVPPLVVPVLEKIRMLLGQKLGNMMRLCPEGNLEELYKHVPISLIPKQYGGEACINEIVDYWKQKMEEYKDWFLEDAIFRTDETKRIEDKFGDDYFGVDGSFRKLELD